MLPELGSNRCRMIAVQGRGTAATIQKARLEVGNLWPTGQYRPTSGDIVWAWSTSEQACPKEADIATTPADLVVIWSRPRLIVDVRTLSRRVSNYTLNDEHISRRRSHGATANTPAEHVIWCSRMSECRSALRQETRRSPRKSGTLPDLKVGARSARPAPCCVEGGHGMPVRSTAHNKEGARPPRT